MRLHGLTRWLAPAAALIVVATSVSAQNPPPRRRRPPPDQPGTAQTTPSPPGAQPPAAKPNTPKPYKEVITADAKSDAGVFTVHKVGDKWYFEIPANVLGRDMLWQTEIEQLPEGFGYGGMSVGSKVVRWTRRENKIYLRAVSYRIRAESGEAVKRGVEAANLEPIILAFDVEAEGKDKSAVIDVSHLLVSDVPEFSARQALGGGGLDGGRSYVEKVKAYPTNIEMKSMMTFTSGGGGGFSFMGFRPSLPSITALVHHSMVMLPETPMRGRLADSRLGFFTEGFQDYGRPENRVVEREYIARFRMEKKDPSAKLSEPVKPIVFYISREVPEKWRPYMKKAVEAWNVAFEQAGFKNAIQAKDAPTLDEDPNWDPEDARYNVIRWAPTETENAMGPHVHDPRSGEIISAHIIVWHNVLKLAETWYFVQASPNDVRAQKLPLPEPLMGEILQYIVTHEVGHTLGLRHNYKGSSSFTCAQLRDPTFTNKWGDEASIMDYGRFNYVAQPGDGARLIPKLGQYDLFAIQWGYTPINASNSDGEKPLLDRMASAQVEDPTLRFGGGREVSGRVDDPTEQAEDLGSDPIEATTYGLKNLSRVADFLVSATTKYGDDYDLLNEMYDQMFNQRQIELFHVATLVGGTIETDYHSGHGDVVFKPVSAVRQAQAVRFLVVNGFTTPRDMLRPDILYRIGGGGVQDRVLNVQRFLLMTLLSETRVRRLLDTQAVQPDDAYSVVQLVSDVQNGVWSELRTKTPAVDLYRRNLQRAYLVTMKGRLVGDGASQSDFRPIALGALRDLAAQIDAAIPKAKDPTTILHLKDCRTQINRILYPKQD